MMCMVAQCRWLIIFLSVLGGEERSSEEQTPPEKASSFIAESIKYKICLLCALTGREKGAAVDDMVQCDACCRWLHCACIGINVDYFSSGNPFYCCKPPHPNDNTE